MRSDKRLGDICEKVTDYVASGSFAALKENVLITNEENYAVMVKTADFANGFSKNLTYTDQKGYDFLRNSNLFGGELILSNIGSIGKVFKVPYLNRPMTLASNTVMIKTESPELSDYLFYFFQSEAGYKKLLSISSGTSMLKFNKTDLKNTFVPVYSTEEQIKIIQIFDKVSGLIAMRKKQLQKLDDLVKARFVEMFGEPENNDKRWPVCLLGELCSVGSSKRVYQNEQSTGGVPFWRISDLVSQMDTGTVDSELFIPEEKYSELKQAGLVPITGDILVTSRGTLGRCYIIKAEDRFYFQDGMISWLSKYSNGITPLYLQYLFMMSGFRKQIDSMQAGSTVAYLSIAMLKKLRVMVPKKDVQETFATFVAQTDKSKLTIQQSLDKLELMKKALMQKYFG